MENLIVIAISLIIAGVMVYIIDRKWGGHDDSNQG
jgi:hypothetical protein